MEYAKAIPSLVLVIKQCHLNSNVFTCDKLTPRCFFFSGRTLRTTTVAQALEGCGKIPPPLAVQAVVEGMLPANATTTSGLRQRRLRRGLQLPSITNHQTWSPRSLATAGQAHQQPLLSLISLTTR